MPLTGAADTGAIDGIVIALPDADAAAPDATGTGAVLTTWRRARVLMGAKKALGAADEQAIAAPDADTADAIVEAEHDVALIGAGLSVCTLKASGVPGCRIAGPAAKTTARAVESAPSAGISLPLTHCHCSGLCRARRDRSLATH